MQDMFEAMFIFILAAAITIPVLVSLVSYLQVVSLG